MKKLYIIASGIWGIHSNPKQTRQNYIDYLEEMSFGFDINEYFEYDDSRVSFEKAKEIADIKPDWLRLDPESSDLDNCHISGSIYLTDREYEILNDCFYLESITDLYDTLKN